MKGCIIYFQACLEQEIYFHDFMIDWSIDWLIDWCQESSISNTFRTRKKSLIYKNYIDMMEEVGQPGQRLLTVTGKGWRVG